MNAEDQERLQDDINEALPALTTAMLLKFGVHIKKGPWRDVSLQKLIAKLEEEHGELLVALSNPNGPVYAEVLDECADLANVCLIIASNVKRGAKYV